jgi:hypothetical protein
MICAFQISVPKGGYVPGECITTTVDINNQSTRQMKAVEVRLVQVTNYTAERHGHGRQHSKSESRTVCEDSEEGDVSRAGLRQSIIVSVALRGVATNAPLWCRWV